MSFAIRLGRYYLQGRNGWGPRSEANAYPTEAKARSVLRGVPREGATVVELARVDTNRTAEPKTRLLGHVQADGRDGVTIYLPTGDTHEDVETGKRTALDGGAS